VSSLVRRRRSAAPSHTFAARPGTAAITVAVVAASPVIVERVRDALGREGVASRVEHGGEVHLRRDALAGRPDVVVLTGGDPRKLLSEADRVRRLLRDVRIVADLAADAPGDVRDLLETGIDGVVSERDFDDAIGLVIRAVHSGYVALPRMMRHAVDPPVFTQRERDVFTLVLEGFSNAEIAERCFLAPSTVAGCLTGIYRRLGVQTRAEAMALVMDADDSLRAALVARKDDGAPRTQASPRERRP
jgi:DNA-binding NarL/FixJ family response regulator